MLADQGVLVLWRSIITKYCKEVLRKYFRGVFFEIVAMVRLFLFIYVIQSANHVGNLLYFIIFSIMSSIAVIGECASPSPM